MLLLVTGSGWIVWNVIGEELKIKLSVVLLERLMSSSGRIRTDNGDEMNAKNTVFINMTIIVSKTILIIKCPHNLITFENSRTFLDILTHEAIPYP